MKKIMYYIFLTMCFFVTPIFGATTVPTPPKYTLELNNLPYRSLYPICTYEDIPYLSAQDLTNLTYGQYVENESEYSLVIQHTPIVINKSNLAVKKNGVNYTFTRNPYTTSNAILYLPLSILDEINYPYTISTEDNLIKIDPLMPYSTSTDTYDRHIKIPAGTYSYTTLLHNVLPQDDIASFLEDCKRNDSYFSFISIKNKVATFNAIRANLSTLQASYEVYLRKINFMDHTPTLADFTVLPLQYRVMDNNSLDVTLGETTTNYQCLWSTYSARLDTPLVDVNKSLDAMLMRVIYENYRNPYNLRDDAAHTSPIIKITRGRSDKMEYFVYTDEDGETASYKVIIYERCAGQKVSFYVDFCKVND